MQTHRHRYSHPPKQPDRQTAGHAPKHSDIIISIFIVSIVIIVIIATPMQSFSRSPSTTSSNASHHQHQYYYHRMQPSYLSWWQSRGAGESGNITPTPQPSSLPSSLSPSSFAPTSPQYDFMLELFYNCLHCAAPVSAESAQQCWLTSPIFTRFRL